MGARNLGPRYAGSGPLAWSIAITVARFIESRRRSKRSASVTWRVASEVTDAYGGANDAAARALIESQFTSTRRFRVPPSTPSPRQAASRGRLPCSCLPFDYFLLSESVQSIRGLRVRAPCSAPSSSKGCRDRRGEGWNYFRKIVIAVRVARSSSRIVARHRLHERCMFSPGCARLPGRPLVPVRCRASHVRRGRYPGRWLPRRELPDDPGDVRPGDDTGDELLVVRGRRAHSLHGRLAE